MSQILLKNVKDEFLETAGYTLDKGIKKNFRGDARDLLRALARGNGHGEGWFKLGTEYGGLFTFN